MSHRARAFAAIIQDGEIVMVRVVDGNRQFWTLPGGGVEGLETLEEAAIREAKEEVNLDIQIIRYLYNCQYTEGIEYCFLAEVIDKYEAVPVLGSDPEYEMDKQVLVETKWRKIEIVKEDSQVSQVLKNLTSEELQRYQIAEKIT
jgi:8-oxo-dGTP diphosphatase